MSSDYIVLCVSHDPAITIDFDYPSPSAALEAAANPLSHTYTAKHANCDLVVGRESGAYIEFACPGGERCKPGRHRYDSDTWTDAAWLRLLHTAHTTGIDTTHMRIPHCWTQQRIKRLADQLGIGRTNE